MGAKVEVPASGKRQPARRRRMSIGPVLATVNSALAGVGGVYLSTHSVVVTAIASVVAVALTGLVLLLG